MKILFLIQNTRVNKKGFSSIIARVTLNTSRKEFSTGIFIRPDHWSKEKQKVLERAENVIN